MRIVIKTGTGGRVIFLGIGVKNRDRIFEAPHIFSIPEPENSNDARLIKQLVVMLHFNLIAIVLKDIPVQGQLVWVIRRDESPPSKRPLIMKILRRETPGIATGIGCKVKGRVT